MFPHFIDGETEAKEVEKLAQGLTARRVDRRPSCSPCLCSALSPVVPAFPSLPSLCIEVVVGRWLDLGVQTPRPEALSLPSPGLRFPFWACITDRLRPIWKRLYYPHSFLCPFPGRRVATIRVPPAPTPSLTVCSLRPGPGLGQLLTAQPGTGMPLSTIWGCLPAALAMVQVSRHAQWLAPPSRSHGPLWLRSPGHTYIALNSV